MQWIILSGPDLEKCEVSWVRRKRRLTKHLNFCIVHESRCHLCLSLFWLGDCPRPLEFEKKKLVFKQDGLALSIRLPGKFEEQFPDNLFSQHDWTHITKFNFYVFLPVHWCIKVIRKLVLSLILSVPCLIFSVQMLTLISSFCTIDKQCQFKNCDVHLNMGPCLFWALWWATDLIINNCNGTPKLFLQCSFISFLSYVWTMLHSGEWHRIPVFCFRKAA